MMATLAINGLRFLHDVHTRYYTVLLRKANKLIMKIKRLRTMATEIFRPFMTQEDII